MISFKFDFDANEFEKSIINQLQDSYKKKLSAAGCSGLTLSVKKDSRGELVLSISGDDQQVAKAKKVLGI